EKIVYSLLKERKFEQVLSFFDEKIKENFETEYIVRFKVAILLDFNEFDRAFEFCESLNNDLIPEILINYLKGIVLYFKKDYKEAIKYFDIVVQLDENYEIVYKEKAFCLYFLGRIGECMKDVEKMLTIDDYKISGYEIKGMVYERL